MICLDTALDITPNRYYCERCGKPTCVSCQDEYTSTPESVGMGCVGCRSTLDVLYIICDDADISRVILRLNGDYMHIDISHRALRVARKNVTKIHLQFLTEMTPCLEDMNTGCEVSVKRAIISFLAHEITHNPRAKAMVGDRFTLPCDEGGHSRILYASVRN
jgi:hypothetical protein